MSNTPGVGAMGDAQAIEFIKNTRSGVLTLVDGDRPYAVPVEHYFNGRQLFVLVSGREGQRKIECIKKNPNACFVIYESRRDKPEIVKKGIPCRSVLIEGKVYVDGIREIESKKTGAKARLQRLRFEVEKIGNWQCVSKTCDWPNPWFERFPDMVADVN